MLQFVFFTFSYNCKPIIYTLYYDLRLHFVYRKSPRSVWPKLHNILVTITRTHLSYTICLRNCIAKTFFQKFLVFMNSHLTYPNQIQPNFKITAPTIYPQSFQNLLHQYYNFRLTCFGGILNLVKNQFLGYTYYNDFY